MKDKNSIDDVYNKIEDYIRTTNTSIKPNQVELEKKAQAINKTSMTDLERLHFSTKKENKEESGN